MDQGRPNPESTNHLAVLFDLDGTLADTLRDLAESMNAALARLQRPPHPVAAYRLFVGDGLRMLCRLALGAEGGDEALACRLETLMAAEYAVRQFNHTAVYPGIRELLGALKARGIRMAVLSNKPHPNTVAVVEHLGAAGAFEVILGQVEDWPPKPDPAGALEVARRMGLPPGAFLFLGDTHTDMRTARAAGMVAVGALWGFRDARELHEAGAQSLLEHPMDLLACFPSG